MQFTLPEQSDWCDMPIRSNNYAPVLLVNISRPYLSTRPQGMRNKIWCLGTRLPLQLPMLIPQCSILVAYGELCNTPATLGKFNWPSAMVVLAACWHAIIPCPFTMPLKLFFFFFRFDVMKEETAYCFHNTFLTCS